MNGKGFHVYQETNLETSDSADGGTGAHLAHGHRGHHDGFHENVEVSSSKVSFSTVINTGSPPSYTATQEFVVPKSIPIILLIIFNFLS